MALPESIRHLPLFYDNTTSDASALQLILTLRPEWTPLKSHIEFKRFTDGITNTLLKATLKQPGVSTSEADKDAVLLRAYGKGTGVLIDRDRECTSHSLLAQHQLAPPLLARFENGLLYQYLQGSACTPTDLRQPEIWRAVAQRLGQWHSVMPIPKGNKLQNGITNGITETKPNLWSTLRKWIEALPTKTSEQRTRRETLDNELDFLVGELGNTQGICGHKVVFCHCDLLCGNVIIEPPPSKDAVNASGQGMTATVAGTTRWGTYYSSHPDRPLGQAQPSKPCASGERPVSVSFIDYEYATPAPAAFDIANHFAEWGGFDCDYSALPTRSQRRDFLQHYVHSYRSRVGEPTNGIRRGPIDDDIEQLFNEVDRFRGVPGFYWGIWALIQATISQIDFDYASYAEVRLDEYWEWKRLTTTDQAQKPVPQTPREKRWAEE